MNETVILPADVLGCTTDIVSAYVSHHVVPVSDIPALIALVHAALLSVVDTKHKQAGHNLPNRPEPAVAVKKSVQDDFIVCLEDGKKLKMLKRHLMSAYGLTPEQYRERWNLPADYPMVAPSYAAKRSSLAKSIGLGQTGKAGRKGKKK